MLGFTLARLSYLNIAGSAQMSFKNKVSPGEWFWYRSGIYHSGITLHLGTILPAGLLIIWQFLPIIRHKLLILHRIDGYVIILLVFLSNIGALMICRHAFGGTLATQSGVGTLTILTTVSICLAYYNIKRLQIDQHRAWMLRMVFYLGTIITVRLIMIISALIVSMINSYDTVMSCAELIFLYGSSIPVKQFYPPCAQSVDPANQLVVIHADFNSGRPEQIGASLGINFGMAIWLALIIHLVGVEIYLGLTPRESNRLRQASYERQMEKGFNNPGSSGLTSDRWGDADTWQPVRELNRSEK